jgi:hypothetical protein
MSRHADSPVPQEQQLACTLWKAHRIAEQGLGDGSVTWWTLQPIERMWWIKTVEKLADAGWTLTPAPVSSGEPGTCKAGHLGCDFDSAPVVTPSASGDAS